MNTPAAPDMHVPQVHFRNPNSPGAAGAANRPTWDSMENEMKLTKRKREVLSELCKCEDSKGVPLPRNDRRTGAALIRDGLAFSLGFGSFEVFIATKEGREALAQ